MAHNRVKKGNDISGWIVLDKPLEISSAQAVGAVKRRLKPKKIGHAGTLDPLASGILPLALGEATKTVPFMMSADKGYAFSVAWGSSTQTDDLEGDVIATSDVRPTEEQILAVIPQFLGEIQQAPPIYSALKIAGQRAYKLARSGDLSELPKRTVTAFELELVACETDAAHFQLRCGKGFYVRSLARDLGEALGTKAHVIALRRTHVGPFGLNQAISLEFLDSIVDKPDQVLPVLPLDVVLDDIPVLTLSDEQARYLRQGRYIPSSELYVLNSTVDEMAIGLAKFEGQPLGLVEFDEGWLKAKRLFNLNPEQSLGEGLAADFIAAST